MQASRADDFEGLLAVLDPDVVVRADRSIPKGAPLEFRGAREVASRALFFRQLAEFAQPVLVNGAAGYLVAPQGRLFAVAALTVVGGRITEIDFVTDPDKLSKLALS
jgi:RNA polymerase sigma-70 factor, ECF subfamily